MCRDQTGNGGVGDYGDPGFDFHPQLWGRGAAPGGAVGNVETKSGGRQVFGAVARADTDLAGLIRRNLDAVGCTNGTALTAFADGCPGLRSILADADVTTPPLLDWFHIAVRLQHLKQIASALSTDDPARVAAKAVIVAEVERLHWRLWNGKAKKCANQHRSDPRAHASFSGRARQAKVHRARTKVVDRPAGSGRLSDRPERLAGQLRRAPPRWLAGGDRNHRRNGQFPGQPADEQITADALVRRGADLLLQVRCAIYNGTLGSRFG